MRNKIFVVIISALLTGCISLIPDQGSEPKKYSLSTNPRAKSLTLNNDQITVEEPKSSMDLDSTRIAVTSDGEHSFIKDKEWNERLPLMLQRLIINNLESSYRIVGKPEDGYIPELVIIPTVQNFEIENLENVHVAMEYKFMRMKDRKVLKSINYEVRVPVDGENFKDIMRGFNEALSKCMPITTEHEK